MSAIRKNTALSKEEKKAAINKVRAGIKAKRAEKRAFVKSIHADSKPIIKALALELVAAKKAAKIETLKFKKDLTDKRDAELSALTAKLKATSDAEERKAIEAQIEKVKTEYINNVRITRAEAKKQALKVMEEVGIPQPARRFRQYPFEFSGGMRQRIVIAIALIQNPDVLICDEPTTALDVTIQAQILELINRLKRERNLSVIFITHDLGVVANMADRVAVMYAGKIVEYGLVNELFYDPRHPYTWALLSSIPDVDSRERLEAIPGTPPNMVYPPKGDAFAPRSRYAMAIDFKEEPPYFKVSETHYAKTWLLDPRAPKAEMPNIVASRIKNSLKKGGKKDE
ncbi:MAG: oligopeptide/dipeptide ABC transporter ATP-binding protein [Bacilli bacterium]